MQVCSKVSSKYTIKSIFREVQFSKTNHSSLKKVLTKIFERSNISDFLAEFIKCLKVCLMHEDKSTNVERTLDFAADFAVSFSFDLKEDETCPLLEGTFQFIFDNHDYYVQLVRLRICQLMNRLLDSMGHDATVVEETYYKIAESMSVRLQDSMSSVRAQAVYALHRLQSPNDPNCEIIKAFMFHMTRDPCHEVRRAVVQKIAVNKMTLATILTRMNDVKDSVRKEAYIIISRYLIRQFTIKQRQLILETGLGDRSEMIREYTIDVLVPNWIKYFNHNYYDFLECIHVEKIPDTAIKLLKSIFGKQHDVILESRVKEMCIVNQKIAYNKLNIITVVYWRALAEYAKPTDDSDKFEHIFQQVLPDLTPFCKYIRGYFFPQKTLDQPPSSDSELSSDRGQQLTDMEVHREESEEVIPPTSGDTSPRAKDTTKKSPPDDKKSTNDPHVPDEAVLVHLLEMCKVYDLGDEMGRNNLRQMCVDFLQSELVTLQSIPVLANLLDHTIPNTTTKLSVMAEIISELREPLQSSESSVYVPDLLLQEAEDKKAELGEKLAELETEMEIAEELGDGERVEELKIMKANYKEELKIMDAVTPNEPGRTENNDPATLIKCLTIVVEILNKGKISRMNPTLYSLMQNFIIPTLSLKVPGDGSSVIKNLALQVLGIFCVLDADLAKEHFVMFCFHIANESVSVTALKCVFDLIHIYGLGNFNIETPDEASMRDTPEQDGSRKPNLVILLVSLLNSQSPEMRKTAVIGLCKLLFAGRIKSPDLVCKLIILWYNPLVECDPNIRQPLAIFFRMFSSKCRHAPSVLLKAFVPTIKEFFQLEVSDPMVDVEVESVANLLVDLTRPGINIHETKELCVHNQIAINICEEILGGELEPLNCMLLMKVLNHLDLDFSLTTDITILCSLISKMLKSIPKEEKVLTRTVTKFETMLQVTQESNKTVSTVNNTLPAETSFKSTATSRSSQFLISTHENLDSDGEGKPDEEEEEEELSQDETLLHTIVDDSEAIVIPGTPESSDSDSDDVFLGFIPPAEKSARISQDSYFKLPAAPSTRTPAKTPFKVPKKTSSKTLDSSFEQMSVNTPAKSSKAPAKVSKTPAKTPKTTRTSARTPKQEKDELSTNETPVSERITRSSRKRKS